MLANNYRDYLPENIKKKRASTPTPRRKTEEDISREKQLRENINQLNNLKSQFEEKNISTEEYRNELDNRERELINEIFELQDTYDRNKRSKSPQYGLTRLLEKKNKELKDVMELKKMNNFPLALFKVNRAIEGNESAINSINDRYRSKPQEQQPESWKSYFYNKASNLGNQLLEYTKTDPNDTYRRSPFGLGGRRKKRRTHRKRRQSRRKRRYTRFRY